MSKQDRQGVRTPAEVERKHKFEKIRGTADSALSVAQEAKRAAENLDGNLTQEEIFNRLTNDGKMKGIYMHDGELYINATYIKTGEFMADLIKAGVIKSVDGKSIVIDLDKGTATLTGSITTEEQQDDESESVYTKVTPTNIHLVASTPLQTQVRDIKLTKKGLNIRYIGDGFDNEIDIFADTPCIAIRDCGTGKSIEISLENGSTRIKGIDAPTEDTDAANKAYVDAQIAEIRALLS